MLLLVSNKRDGDRCVMDIQASTEQFIGACGDSFKMLDQFFSALVCIYLPNKRNQTVDEQGNVHDGAEMFALQISKLKVRRHAADMLAQPPASTAATVALTSTRHPRFTFLQRLLSALMRTRLVTRYQGGNGGGRAGDGAGSQSRLITSKQGLWYDLVPRVIRELNGGRQVHVTRLVDEAWAAAMAKTSGDREAANDIMKSFASYLRPAPSLSASAALLHEDMLMRFNAYHALACAVAVRIAAARLRAVDPAWRIDIRVRNFARAQIDAMLSVLDDVTPCKAVYGAGATSSHEIGTPVERPGEPVLCLQERRVHSKGHRAARRVRGGGRTLWQKLASLLPHNPTWDGNFEAAHVAKPDIEALVDDCVGLLDGDDADFLRALRSLQEEHSSSSASISFAALPGAQRISASHSAAAFAVPVRPEPLSGVSMPYCIGCADKIVLAAPASESEADLALQLPRAPRQGWLAAKVTEVLQTMGVVSTDAPAAATLHFSTGSLPAATRTSAATATETAPGSRRGSQSDVPSDVAVQQCAFGLCQHCLDVIVR